MNDYRLIVTSVISANLEHEPRTVACRNIIKHWGYNFSPYVDRAWTGWPCKLRHIIKFSKRVQQENHYTHIMFIDARDVILLGTPKQVMDKFLQFNHPWVYNAEPFIWSPGSFLPSDYPPCDTPWPYLNSGACIAEVNHMVHYFDKWTDGGANPPIHLPRGDQDWTAARFLEDYPDAIKLDNDCELFQCMCGSLTATNPHCIMTPGQVFNQTTNTHPLIVHFNGGDDITSPTRSILWKSLLKTSITKQHQNASMQ